MAGSERKRQEKLARKAAKRRHHSHEIRRAEAESGHGMSLTRQLALAAGSPFHECLIPERLFEEGIGTVVVSRQLPSGDTAAAVFLLDVWCLGVKNAFARVGPDFEYRTLVREIEERETLIPIDPTCARKLVEDAAGYAAGLGFPPHPDYEVSRRIFGDLDRNACPTQYRFGRDGKPFYASGPYDTPAKSRRIVESLMKRFGPDGAHYLVAAHDPADLAFMEAEEELDEPGRVLEAEVDHAEAEEDLEDVQPTGVRSWLSRLSPFKH